MLTTVLVLQVLLLFFILVLSIVGWRQLTEDRQKLTDKLTEDSQKLTEDWQKLTEKLIEKKVSVSYEHVIYYKDGLFKNVVVASSRVQFFYEGLPIGEPTEKIVYSSNKVDKEAVQNALTVALQTLQIAISTSGTPLTVLNKIEDAIKILSK